MLFREAGHQVTGSDRAFDAPMGPALQKSGVTCLVGFDPAHLSPAPDLVVVGNAIGLALEEHPVISTGCDDEIEPGGVYSLRVGLSDPRGHAIVSAMVAVHDWGNEVLWFSPEPAR